jgi:23S rRNA pseudouridine2605 synthase
MAEVRSPADEGERLQKVLARAGYGSRRTCDELVADGRVEVNGEPARLGHRVDVARDLVRVDGAPVGIIPGLVHYLLNKPRGVVSTAKDPQGRPTVISLVPAEPRVFSVGRLDAMTEGLLILTNDGELAQQLAHPSGEVEKEYLAEVEGDPGPGALRRLREGVEIEPGVVTAPARVSRRAAGVLRIAVHEGRYHEVRRMCEAVGHPVVRLVRTRIGPLTDPHLEPGCWRPLRSDEVRSLAEASAVSSTTVIRSGDDEEDETSSKVPPADR